MDLFLEELMLSEGGLCLENDLWSGFIFGDYEIKRLETFTRTQQYYMTE